MSEPIPFCVTLVRQVKSDEAERQADLLFKHDESRSITIVGPTMVQQVNGGFEAVQNDPFRAKGLEVQDVRI